MIFRILLISALVAFITCDSCSNPSGDDCSWYANCLEKQIPCGANGYAIKYAKQYCQKYMDNSPRFSIYGKYWIAEVKRCLQRKLAPLLQKKPSCDKVKQFAFDTHVECYTQPSVGGPSFCKLSVGDYWEVFKTINGAFLTEFKATVSGGWDTLVACYNKKGKKR